MSPLLNIWKFFGNLGKSTGECRKQTFRQVSEISENFRKSSEVFGNLRKSGNLRKKIKNVANCLKQPSSVFEFFQIFGNFRKSGKISVNVGKFSKRSSDTFWKFSKIFVDLRKFEWKGPRRARTFFPPQLSKFPRFDRPKRKNWSMVRDILARTCSENSCVSFKNWLVGLARSDKRKATLDRYLFLKKDR